MGLCIDTKIYQRLAVGETIGDIPLFSLHKIKSVSIRKPLGLHHEIEKMLSIGIIEQNEKYKQESGTDRYCIPANCLVEIVDNINDWFNRGIDAIKVNVDAETMAKIDKARISVIKTIQQWFDDNFDDLLYDMNGNVPWNIVLMLRKRLKQWIDDVKTNPFTQNIDDAILEVAKEEGIDTDDPNEAWKKMGGKVFKKKSRAE